eukprot:10970860-Lingulodinium_polyedra.AAC.1
MGVSRGAFAATCPPPADPREQCYRVQHNGIKPPTQLANRRVDLRPGREGRGDRGNAKPGERRRY